MPFKSQAQARWMFAQKPAMAQEWARSTQSIKALPQHTTKHMKRKALLQQMRQK